MHICRNGCLNQIFLILFDFPFPSGLGAYAPDYLSGVVADQVAREYGISRATLYNWKSKYSGMEVNQISRLKELEDENRRLKQMYADLALDNKILKDVIEKKL